MVYNHRMNYKNKPKGTYHASESNREWYTKRNFEVFKDKLEGLSNTELITKYQISLARIQSIIAKERAKHEFNR
jgi:Mor family transcriptional regulator